MTILCRNCHQSSVLGKGGMYVLEISDISGTVKHETILCKNCKEAFEWGEAVVATDDEASFDYLTGNYEKTHDLDEWHTYRNALAAALAGVAGESRAACTSAANIVIDRRILPPAGEVRQTYRDCGLFAVMYAVMEEEEPHYDVTSEKLPIEKFTEYLLHGDVDVLRMVYGYRKPEVVDE